MPLKALCLPLAPPNCPAMTHTLKIKGCWHRGVVLLAQAWGSDSLVCPEAGLHILGAPR